MMSASIRSRQAASMAISGPMLTKDETAALLAVSIRTLDRIVLAGELPAYRIGGHRRFRVEDVEAYVASRREGL
jgi:excisionase family DNA binding protein